MDDELLELQRQFEFAQQVKSSVRLSDRNVVELVMKLQELCVIDFDLLHTVTGKEFITQGEIISQNYWDSIAEEINERLQECSQIAVAELAGQLQVGYDLVQSVLEPRLRTLVKARLEGGLQAVIGRSGEAKQTCRSRSCIEKADVLGYQTKRVHFWHGHWVFYIFERCQIG
ncbi:unnamed protein product [Arabidopsis arenosa]|uniref:E3 UFM1-protein ligase 1-like N-terminal domain-containing protein n=1 Tax=Arabidopsis arenosa TaxID=38785 RepID=A0A8S2AER4_ARAAE|nr:unnamed protein product [Arabidopsis arenosa]